MHDAIIAHKIMDEASKHGKVIAVEVEVGELAGLHDHDVKETLKEMTDWDVRVSEKKATVKCGRCGFEGRPKITGRTHDEVLYECPKCHKIPKVIDGDQVILKEVKVE